MITVQKEIRLKDFEPDGYANYVFKHLDDDFSNEDIWTDLENAINETYGVLTIEEINDLFSTDEQVAGLLGYSSYDDLVDSYNREIRSWE